MRKKRPFIDSLWADISYTHDLIQIQTLSNNVIWYPVTRKEMSAKPRLISWCYRFDGNWTSYLERLIVFLCVLRISIIGCLSVGPSIGNQLVKINTNQWNYMKLYENKWKSMQSSPETLNKVIKISTNCFIHLSVSLSISNQFIKINPNQ